MSNRITPEKARAIAAAYCENDHKKVLGMLAVGYSENYARSGKGLKVYDNALVKKEIALLEAESAKKTGFTIEKAQQMYEEDRDFARKCRQSGAAVTATTGICRLYGMDKDAGTGEKTVIIISPKAPKRP